MAYDLSYYQRRRITLNNQISDRRRKNQQIQREIDRLQTAYDNLKRLKNNEADSLRRDVKLKNCGNGLSWRANSKTNFDNHVNNDLKKSADHYYSDIDRMLDNIGKTIGRKKGDIDYGNSLINSWNRTLQSVISTINNWFN